MTHQSWIIAAGMLQFPALLRNGERVQEAPKENWAESFTQIRDIGFENVEINDNWLRVGELSSGRIDEVAEAAAQAQLAISSVAVVRSSITDPSSGVDNLAYTHRTLDAAAQLGASTVSIGFHRQLTPAQAEALWFWTEPGLGDRLDDPDLWRTTVNQLRELGGHAAQLGLELSVEMYEDTLVGTAASAIRLIEEVGLDNVGLNPDIGNLVRRHGPIEDWQETLSATLPHANYWHVKNYLRDEDRARGIVSTFPAPLQTGFVNYRWAIHEAILAGFTGIFVCEHYGGDGLGVSAVNREYLKTLLPNPRKGTQP